MEKEESYILYETDEFDSSQLNITGIFVPKHERGCGKGRELVKSAIEYAKDNGYKTVALYAEPQSDDGLDGEALIEFYRSCGFVSDGDMNQLMTYTL